MGAASHSRFSRTVSRILGKWTSGKWKAGAVMGRARDVLPAARRGRNVPKRRARSENTQPEAIGQDLS